MIHASRSQERRHTLYGLAAFFCFLSIAAYTLLKFPPELCAFYPRCPIHEYLYIDCPGCGATRALSALLHGHIAAAIHLNALAILVLLPAAILYSTITIAGALRNEDFRWPIIPIRVTYSVAAVTAAFTLFRNL